jgi:hypothetical protein
MTWVSIAEQPHTSLKEWSGIKLTAIGLWSSGNSFSGVMTQAMFQHLLESLPRRVEAFIAAKGGPTS